MRELLTNCNSQPSEWLRILDSSATSRNGSYRCSASHTKRSRHGSACGGDGECLVPSQPLVLADMRIPSIILDRYTASYIGRPGTIHERDYDTSFPSEDEPDEHEQWRPIRPDGTEWSMSPKNPEEAAVRPVKTFPPTKAHTLSCFNAAGALAVVINRVSIG